MGKDRGAKHQKKLAKQKAKRQAKRQLLARRSSKDPTIRLQRTDHWPIVEALASKNLWDEGIGYLVLAREEPEGGTVFATYLVDVLCLGVKDTFWRAGPREDYRETIRELGKIQPLRPIKPPCLVKILRGAVDFAQSFGFSPHADFRHAALLLAGIDPAECTEEFAFGDDDGRPHYFQGPHETPAQAAAIVARMQEVGGHFTVGGPGGSLDDLDEGDFDDEGEDERDDPVWIWRPPLGGR